LTAARSVDGFPEHPAAGNLARANRLGAGGARQRLRNAWRRAALTGCLSQPRS
jgi:hypothetical protein